MKPLRSEDLKHRIEIRRPTQASDGEGGYTTTWPVIASPMAEVTGLDGRESVMEHVLQGVSVYRLRIRWRRNLLLKPSDQVRWAGLDLDLKSAVDPDGRREQLVIMADTGSPQATA